MMKATCVLSLVAIILTFQQTPTAQSDSDSVLFAQGRVSFDKFHDCKAAYAAFDKVTGSTRSNPLWVHYMARVSECLKDWKSALRYYLAYDKLLPNQSEVLDKIGEMRYLIEKQPEIEKGEQLAEAQAKAIQDRKDLGALLRKLADRALGDGSVSYKHRVKSGVLVDATYRVISFRSDGCKITFRDGTRYEYDSTFAEEDADQTVNLVDVDSPNVKVSAERARNAFLVSMPVKPDAPRIIYRSQGDTNYQGSDYTPNITKQLDEVSILFPTRQQAAQFASQLNEAASRCQEGIRP